jgi:hypothetical protein
MDDEKQSREKEASRKSAQETDWHEGYRDFSVAPPWNQRLNSVNGHCC